MLCYVLSCTAPLDGVNQLLCQPERAINTTKTWCRAIGNLLESHQVHVEVSTMRFEWSAEEPHCHKFSPEFAGHVHGNELQLLCSMEENMVGHTNQQKERAKETRKLFHTMWAPTVQNFKHTTQSNKIKNCPMTAEDINMAEKIHRKDISHLKGKTTEVAEFGTYPQQKQAQKPINVDAV